MILVSPFFPLCLKLAGPPALTLPEFASFLPWYIAERPRARINFREFSSSARLLLCSHVTAPPLSRLQALFAENTL